MSVSGANSSHERFTLTAEGPDIATKVSCLSSHVPGWLSRIYQTRASLGHTLRRVRWAWRRGDKRRICLLKRMKIKTLLRNATTRESGSPPVRYAKFFVYAEHSQIAAPLMTMNGRQGTGTKHQGEDIEESEFTLSALVHTNTMLATYCPLMRIIQTTKRCP